MEIVLYLIHIVVCFVLIMVVLLQSGKAADLAGAFGGGGSQTALGSRGAATVLTKATTVCAILFMLTSLGLAIFGSRRGGSVLEQVPVPAPASENAPASTPSQEAAPPAADQQRPAGAEGAAPAGEAPKDQPPPEKK